LQALGGISYCVYIVHDAINQLAHRILLHAEPQIYNWKGVGTTFLALLLTLSIASVSWIFLEKPQIRRGREFSY
jgi:peptidoglycan/LPS O-acetylase OafA/YrhL